MLLGVSGTRPETKTAVPVARQAGMVRVMMQVGDGLRKTLRT
jgi:hypothetical protein